MNLSTLKPEYLEVGYSIHTPTYFDRGDFSFPGETEREAFYADCRRVFEAGGWKIEGVYAVNGKSSLHLHPQQILGIVHVKLANQIPSLITQATTFRFQTGGQRIIREFYDISEAQQWEHLAKKRPEIEADLLTAFHTSRRNKYLVPGNLLWWSIELPIGKKYGIPSIDAKIENAAGRYVSEVFLSLLKDGRIICIMHKNAPAYRTALKSELPAVKKKTKLQTDSTMALS